MSPLFDQLLKHERAEVLAYAKEPAIACASIKPRIAEMWDWEGYHRSQGRGADWTSYVAAGRALVYPEDWTAEQVITALAIEAEVGAMNQDLGIARRIVHDDPAELALGVSLGARLAWLMRKLDEQKGAGMAEDDASVGMGALPVMDVALIRMVIDAPILDDEPGRRLLYQGVAAAFHRDLQALRGVVERFNKRGVYRDLEGMRTCLTGVAGEDPERVTVGLTEILENENRNRKKKEGRIISLDAHQFYRLAEWFSPELVAGFDVTQPLPWDAGFHAYTKAHPDPLEGLDLSDISPLLHDALIHLKLPAWWRVPEEPELGSDPCRLILTDLGPTPGPVREMIDHWVQFRHYPAADLDNCPAVIAPEVSRAVAFDMKRGLRQFGASARVEKR